METKPNYITVSSGDLGDLVTTTITYDYDPLYRLTSAAYSSGEVYTYTYGAVGNRLAMGAGGEVSTYTYDPANRLTSVDGVGYTWDDNGNLLDDGIRTYDYDYANRLIAVVSGTLTTTYIYNGDGHRVAKTENGETTTYAVAVLGLSQVLIETTAGDSILYLYGHDLLAEEDDTWKWHLGDGLGSVRQLVDSGGGISLAQGYTPFGVPLWSEGWGTTGYGFTGERWEAYNELLFLRARYYQPELGIFTTRDPVSSEPPYSYAGANPINIVDPTGMWRWRLSSGSIYHDLVEAFYEGTAFGSFNPTKQLEYTIPGSRRRPDMFNSVSGAVYEVEPWYMASSSSHGTAQANAYSIELLNAGGNGLLSGTYFGIPYNWNNTPFHLGTGVDWHGKLRLTLPGFPMVDFVADYVSPGLVLYWLEPKLRIPVPFVVPNKRLVRPRDWVPGSPAWAPSYVLSWEQACGGVLIAVGGTIIVVTLVEDVATLGLGTIDDVITLPGGYLLIDLGRRMATFAPGTVR